MTSDGAWWWPTLRPPAPGYDVLADAFGEVLAAAGCAPDEAERYRERSAPVLLAYLEQALISDTQPVAVEHGFGLDVALPGEQVPLRFVGYVDRIDRGSDGVIEILDHKAGRQRSQEDVDADPQLTAYAFACARGGLRDPDTGAALPPAARLGLHFAETGVMLWTTRSPEQLQSFAASLAATVAAIRRRAFDPRPGRGCRWCEYRASCPSAVAPSVA